MRWTTRFKQLIYPAYILIKASPLKKRKIKKLFRYYHELAKSNTYAHHSQNELRVFSSLNEDGIILWIMATLGIRQGYFIDIGSNDCINSNCALPALVFDWEGVFVDSDKKQLAIGKRNYRVFGKGHRLRFACAFVTPSNINNIIASYIAREPDLVSIDIDGNDYEILMALNCRPKVIVVENKVEYGCHDIAITASNGAGFDHAYLGASPYTMTKLAEEKGYTLIAANTYGFNTFYLRNDLVSDILPPLPLDVLLRNPLVSKDFYPESVVHEIRQKLHAALWR